MGISSWPSAKDPSDILDYFFDWSGWLNSQDTIKSVTLTVTDGIDIDSYEFTDSMVTLWLSGGTAGNSYIVTCKIVTNNGKTCERSAKIKVSER